MAWICPPARMQKGRHVIDVAIVNGSLLNPSPEGHDLRRRQATLAIHEGRIQAVLDPAETVDAAQVLDAEGMLVLPGAIDVHFHCRAPAFPRRGDFATETRAAAAGGVTTVFEMPISKPGVSTAHIWESRAALVRRQAFVNVGLYGSPGLLLSEEIEAMAAAGAIGFKLFLTRAPEGREDEFDGLVATDLASVVAALELVRSTGLPCVFHAEEQSLVDLYSTRALTSPGPDFRRHGRSRPAIVEATAVAALIAIAQQLDTHIHIAHVSAKATVDLLRYARAVGAPVTAETCPHYLFFTEDILEEIGPYGKINPPLRAAEDRDALWGALLEGILAVIASDHSPFTAEEKEATWGHILDAPPGHPGVEGLVPLVLTEALRGRFSLERAVQFISTGPAQLFNLYPRKGTLQPGADADITIYDPRPARQIKRAEWLSRAAACNRLYDGMTIQGEVYATLLGGKLIYHGGRVLGRPGDGKIVRPLSWAP